MDALLNCQRLVSLIVRSANEQSMPMIFTKSSPATSRCRFLGDCCGRLIGVNYFTVEGVVEICQ